MMNAMTGFDRTKDKLLRIGEVKARTGLSTATIYRRVAQGTFPPKRQISPKLVAWYESDVGAWIADPMSYRVPSYDECQ